MDVKEELLLGEKIGEHWYYVSKGRAVLKFLGSIRPGSLIDVGAGSGIFSRLLLDHGWRESVCVDPAYPEEYTDIHHGKPIRFVHAIANMRADLVLMMDVCEHVDDDFGLIRHYASMVEDETYFLITVPAFQFLFSGHDVFLEHRRRYTVSSLVRCVEGAGLEVINSSYFFATVFPIALVQRLIEKALVGLRVQQPKSGLRMHSHAVNRALEYACSIELPIFPFNKAFGLSVFCLARKPRRKAP